MILSTQSLSHPAALLRLSLEMHSSAELLHCLHLVHGFDWCHHCSGGHPEDSRGHLMLSMNITVRQFLDFVTS